MPGKYPPSFAATFVISANIFESISVREDKNLKDRGEEQRGERSGEMEHLYSVCRGAGSGRWVEACQVDQYSPRALRQVLLCKTY